VTARAALPGLDADTALEPLGGGRWRGAVSERWWIERGPYGGYLAALLVRALAAAVDDPRRAPRSLTVHFLDAPSPGEVEVAATVERVGRSSTAVALRLEQRGRPMALALASAGAWRDGEPAWVGLRAPEVPPPEDCPPLPAAPGLPPFLDNFEIRWAQGGRLGRPAERPRNVTWVRPRGAAALHHVAAAALSDTMVPAAFSLLGRAAVVPTLDLTIHFRAPLPPPGDDGWGLAVFSSRLSAGGTWEEDGELWSPGGVLLTQSRQLAMIRGATERPPVAASKAG
jgi:acyl-CoA thioesterase